jgi:N-acetylglutamate synthase-like GNAT family acetyltransferase
MCFTARQELLEITTPDPVSDRELRERACTSPKGQMTKQYVFLEDGREVAFLSLDHRRDLGVLVLYEMFVPMGLRHQGIGSRLLQYAERMAKRDGYKKVFVWPKPFEQNYPRADLVEWYRKHGYSERSDCPDEMEKQV